MSGWWVVKNRNRSDLPLEMLAYLGASDERGLTGQGFGSKYASILALSKGLEIQRASHDGRGRYIAQYVSEDFQIPGRTKVDQKIAVFGTRESGDDEMIEMSVLMGMVKNAWGEHPLGDHYSIVREVILDAADEDPNFRWAKVEEVSYAPVGETWTFITSIPEIDNIFQDFPYWFKRKSEWKKVTTVLAVAPSSTVNETRVFITTEEATLAYFAWSTGDSDANQGAFDYVFFETKTTKWASLPKRYLERSQDIPWHILKSLAICRDSHVLESVFKLALDGLYEDGLPWENLTYWANTESISLWRKIVGDALQWKPIIKEGDQESMKLALNHTLSFRSLPTKYYDLAKKLGIASLHDTIVPKDFEIAPLSVDEAVRIRRLTATLPARVQGVLEKHVIMAEKKNYGGHRPDFAGKDVITVQVSLDDDLLRKTLVHECAHHVADNKFSCGHDDIWGGAIIDLLM